MAIYHLEAKVVSRGVGRSAVAAAAYMSCSQITNEYDGIQHDYTRKQGLVWEQIFLPEMALQEWRDRSALWNAVEETEKTKDSRLAREFVVALPIELSREDNIALLAEYVQDSFVSDGMCADVCIHDTDGHNPHAHILLTVRPLDEQGKWQYKTEKEYLCVRNGKERGFTAAEYRAAQNEGWEKQYQYQVGKKKVYMTPSVADMQDYERISKYPKSTKFGRQNPITERWNSEDQLVLWRRAWVETANRHLERSGIQEQIDHRSHAERGITEQPTVHEGVEARAMERKGIVSDRCALNRQIKADNKLLRELKNTFHALVKAVKDTIPVMAEALEKARQKIFIFCYQIKYLQVDKWDLSMSLKSLRPDFQKYTGVVQELKAKRKQRKDLLAEKKDTPVLRVGRHMELSRKIATLTEELEELRNEKNALLLSFNKSDDAGMKEVRKRVDDLEASLKKLEDAESRYTAELNAALEQYKELTAQSDGMGAEALTEQRQAIRPAIMQSGADRIREAYGRNIDYEALQWARAEVRKLLDEEPERKPSIHEMLKRPVKQAQRQTPPKKKRRDDMER